MTLSLIPGSVSCDACPAGSIAEEGTHCTQCKKGEMSSMGEVCIGCPPGTFSQYTSGNEFILYWNLISYTFLEL